MPASWCIPSPGPSSLVAQPSGCLFSGPAGTWGFLLPFGEVPPAWQHGRPWTKLPCTACLTIY